MNRSLSFAGSVLLALVGLASLAPAGPGDAEPIGPGPHVIVHAPASITRSQQKCFVWSHDFNMPCGLMGELTYSTSTTSGQAPLLSYELYDLEGDHWDERYEVDLLQIDLTTTPNIIWVSNAMEMCEWGVSTGTATTLVTN